MHIYGGTLAILCMIWQFSKCWEKLLVDLQEGIGFMAGIALAGYFLGCILGAIVNVFLMFVTDKEKP